MTLLVNGKKWSRPQLVEFSEKYGVGASLPKERQKFIPNLLHFMTENEFADFTFESEDQLKSELVSEYVDEYMSELSQYQRLTRDKRGEEFIIQNFKPNKDLKSDGGVVKAPPRDLKNGKYTFELNTIARLLSAPESRCMIT
jgi:hypothetical protein